MTCQTGLISYKLQPDRLTAQLVLTVGSLQDERGVLRRDINKGVAVEDIDLADGTRGDAGLAGDGAQGWAPYTLPELEREKGPTAGSFIIISGLNLKPRKRRAQKNKKAVKLRR